MQREGAGPAGSAATPGHHSPQQGKEEEEPQTRTGPREFAPVLGANEHTSPGEKESCPEPWPGQNRPLCPPQTSLSRTRPSADTTGAGGTAEQCQPQSTHPDTCYYQGEGAQGAWPSRQTRATSTGSGRSALGAHRKLRGRLSSSSAQNATPEPNREPTDSPTSGGGGGGARAVRARTTWERPRCGRHRTERCAQQERAQCSAGIPPHPRAHGPWVGWPACCGPEDPGISLALVPLQLERGPPPSCPVSHAAPQPGPSAVTASRLPSLLRRDPYRSGTDYSTDLTSNTFLLKHRPL